MIWEDKPSGVEICSPDVLKSPKRGQITGSTSPVGTGRHHHRRLPSHGENLGPHQRPGTGVSPGGTGSRFALGRGVAGSGRAQLLLAKCCPRHSLAEATAPPQLAGREPAGVGVPHPTEPPAGRITPQPWVTSPGLECARVPSWCEGTWRLPGRSSPSWGRCCRRSHTGGKSETITGKGKKEEQVGGCCSDHRAGHRGQGKGTRGGRTKGRADHTWWKLICCHLKGFAQLRRDKVQQRLWENSPPGFSHLQDQLRASHPPPLPPRQRVWAPPSLPACCCH